MEAKTCFYFLSRNQGYSSIISDIASKLHVSRRSSFAILANSNALLMNRAVEAGYKNATLTTGKECTAWDMALYFACEVDKILYGPEKLGKPEYVWFIEDDVFIPSAEALIKLNESCKDYDLCVPAHKCKTGELMDWHWPKIVGKVERPWFSSMTCACRVSRKLLNVIKEYVRVNGELFFHEVMLNTLARQAGLSIYTPHELKTILWQGDWSLDDYLYMPNNLYHPQKDFAQHQTIRKLIKIAQELKYEPVIGKVPLFLRK